MSTSYVKQGESNTHTHSLMFPLLHGSDDLTLVILSYVNPEDLHNTIVNHATLTIIRNNRLWKDIFERDFHKSQLNLLIVDNDFDIEAQGYRQAYIESYRAFKYKMLSNMDQLEQIDIEMRSHSQLKNKLNWIDAFQFRIMLPLPFLSITLTCLLFALKLDNISNISYLACFLPLILFVSYFFGCLVYTAYQSKIQDSVVWQSMAGPLRVMFSTRIANQPGILFSAVLLLLLQLILLVLKFSTPTLDVSWGLIFLPLWLLSALFCLLPVVQCTYSPVFCTGLLLWIPLFVLFVCLAVKLNKEEHGKKSFLLAEILVPFWLLEVFFLIATVLFVVQAYHT